MRLFARVFLFLCLAVPLQCLAQACPGIPVPTLAGPSFSSMTKVCHTAYVSFYDARLKVPRMVAYELTGKHTLGCVPRASGFHKEGASASPAAYDKSGYDLGHMDPAQDNAWDEEVSKDSFSMINVAPQLPGLNREEWERLEETVRAWALERGDLLIYVGPVVAAKDKAVNGVDIPSAFFKIVVDRKSGAALAFEMPQQDIPKGDLAPWQVTVSAISAATGIQFKLPQRVSAEIWPADIAAWHKAHKAACGN